MDRNTKIVATLGPSSESFSQIEALVRAGMDIARLNFSHGTYEQFEKIVKNVRKAEKTQKKVVLTLQDLQGPKIRLGVLPANGLVVKRGQTLVFDTAGTGVRGIPLPYKALPKLLKPGHRLLIEDGLIQTRVLSVNGAFVTVKVETGGILKSKKGVNIPDSKLPNDLLLSPKDKKDLVFGVTVLKVDAVALSFVEDASDILTVRKRIQTLTKRPVFLIAKIERPKALVNLDQILEVVDGIMIARGDLGVEIPAENVPLEQKRIIERCRAAGKPVIVATQILQSMVENPVASRAEISDAATAIFEQTDAFMLSNETASGKYPLEAVQTLDKVARNTEAAMRENTLLFSEMNSFGKMGGLALDSRMASEACELADTLKVKALIIATKEGYTARAVLRHRPKTPILFFSNNSHTRRLLHFYWGVHSVLEFKGPLRAEKIREKLKSHPFFKKTEVPSTVVFLRLGKFKRSLVVMEIGG